MTPHLVSFFSCCLTCHFLSLLYNLMQSAQFCLGDRMMKWNNCLGVIALLLTLAGCSKDPEAVLPGVWVISPTFGTMAIMKGTESAPSAHAAASAGVAFASMKMDIKEDKTFSYNLGSATMSGNWTFDKDSRMMTLNINNIPSLQTPPAQGAPAPAQVNPSAPGAPPAAQGAPAPAQAAPAPAQTMTWVAKLDDNNERLTLQMAPTWTEPKAGVPDMGNLTGGMPLVRQDSL